MSQGPAPATAPPEAVKSGLKAWLTADVALSTTQAAAQRAYFSWLRFQANPLALAGLVVNDGVILVEFVNQRRRAGAPVHAALMEAGRLRFRPILLTSVTTMLGLVPLTFFAAGEARFLQPMAISIFFGLAAATVLVLILVPVVYALLDDVARRAAGRRGDVGVS